MGTVLGKRMAAQMDGEFVVFLIGMRINKPWKVHKWLPVFLAMPKMIKELEARPESGFLGYNGMGKIIVQYWRSFEHLEAYAQPRRGPLAGVGGLQQEVREQPRRSRDLARDVPDQAGAL